MQPGMSNAKEENYAGQENVYTRLRTQVEFYFSPKNLSRDTYLRKMLTSEHLDMPTPRPAQYMCPVGIITNFPKVRDICSHFSPQLQNEPASLLLVRALDGSNNVVTISSDGNWIGPANQILPPLTMAGVPAGMEGVVGQLPPRIPPQFQTLEYLNQIQAPFIPPPPPLPVQQTQERGEGQGAKYHTQHDHGGPIATGPSPMGYESPSSTSLESLPQHQQQQTHVSNLPPSSSKISIGGTQSAASLSSASDAGAKFGHPISFIGPHGVGDIFPSGPSAPSSMMADNNSNSLPPNSIPHPQRMFPPIHPWPVGINHPPQPLPYYPQQMQHAIMYSQQSGAPQQLQHMQYYPTYSQMGHGVPHPPPQQHSYPHPPPFLPFHGMQQYVDYHQGYPPPPPPPPPSHLSQFHDNRYLDAHGYLGSNDQYQNYSGGQKKRVEKKKHKNNQQPQQQHQYTHRRDSYGSNTSVTPGSRDSESNHIMQRRGTPSPPIGEHHRGNGGNKFKKSGEQSHFRKDHSNAPPSGFHNRSSNRQKQQCDQSLSSDAGPLSSSSRQQQQRSEVEKKNEIFTSSDFPGLGGGEIDGQQLLGDKKSISNLVGYASALLKKKEVPNTEESKPQVSKSMATIPKPVTSPTKAESHNYIPDEVGEEIQTRFQEFCLLEKDGNEQANSYQREQSHDRGDDLNGEIEFCSTSAGAASVLDYPVTNDLMSSSSVNPGNGAKEVTLESEHTTSESLSIVVQPVIDVFNFDDFPARDKSNSIEDVTAGPLSPSTIERAAQPSDRLSYPSSTNREKPNPPGTWGSRRLFADVIKDQR